MACPFNSVVLAPVDPLHLLTRAKIVDYRLQFVPVNPLSSTSAIVITPPGNFQVLTGNKQKVLILKGLDNIVTNNPMVITVTSARVEIKNFQRSSVDNTVVVLLRMINPPSLAGLTSAIVVNSY